MFMMVNSINTGFQKTPPSYPVSFKSSLPRDGALLSLGYIGGSVATYALLDYLEAIALRNRFYHEQIGVYRR